MRKILLHYKSHQKDPIDLSLMGDSLIIFGRESGVDVHLQEKRISRKHCQLLLSEDQSILYLEDLGSLNGTLLNDDALKGRKALKSGDRFRLGSFEFEVEIDLPPAISSPFDQPTQMQEDPHLQQLELEDFDASEAFSPLSEVSAQLSPEDVDFKDYEAAAEAFTSLSQHGETSEQTGGQIISGKLDELSLADVLQMLATTQKSGRLVISPQKLAFAPKKSSEDTAILHLDKGQLKYAEFGELTKEEAFFESLSMENGYFALFPAQTTAFPEVIELPLESLLIQGLSYLDEKRANAVALKESDRFEVQPEEPLNQLEDDELQIFQLIWKHKELKKVLDQCSLQREQAQKIVEKLLRNAFIKKI